MTGCHPRVAVEIAILDFIKASWGEEERLYQWEQTLRALGQGEPLLPPGLTFIESSSSRSGFLHSHVI